MKQYYDNDDELFKKCFNNMRWNQRKVVFTQPLRNEQDVTEGQFLSGAQLVWIQNFPPPRLVEIPELKSSVCCSISVMGNTILSKIWS